MSNTLSVKKLVHCEEYIPVIIIISLLQMDSSKDKGGGGKQKQRVTRSVATMFDFNTEFPLMSSFTPSDKLPDFRSIVGVLRNLLEGEGKGKTTVNMATREVSEIIIAKWFH